MSAQVYNSCFDLSVLKKKIIVLTCIPEEEKYGFRLSILNLEIIIYCGLLSMSPTTAGF